VVGGWCGRSQNNAGKTALSRNEAGKKSVEQRERLTNTALPALFLCGGTSINDLYRSFKVEIPKSSLVGNLGI
jgi:hypothetical protein